MVVHEMNKMREVIPEILDPYEAAPQQLKDVFKSLRSYPSGEQSLEVIDLQELDIPCLDSIPVERYQTALNSFYETTNALHLQYEMALEEASFDEEPYLPPQLGYERGSSKRAQIWHNRRDPSSLFDHLDTYIRPELRPSSFMNWSEATVNKQFTIASAYHSRIIPGLFVLPNLFPPTVQRKLLYCLLHRDLSDPRHQTNLHAHYDVTYPPFRQSFFTLKKTMQICQPKDPHIHKPLTVGDVLSKKLKWMTLGGQYDWTKKEYPKGPAPEFPLDIADLIRGLFPDVEPEAAIMNIYSPGDTLSLHRDVSEESSCGLVSISLGCDGVFVIGLPDAESEGFKHLAIRLRSGDALYMSGESRYAWHGLVKVLPSTCPDYLGGWPYGGNSPSWMRDKRINLSIRQMRHKGPKDG